MRKHCLTLPILYWDDTVIFLNTKRACLRSYGDEKTALYTAHAHKGKEGLAEDKILPLLPPETVVMHDHNIVNYCSDYSFRNIECNAHLLRDLQKVYDLTQHPWATEAKKLIQTQIHKRNQLEAQGMEGFPEEEASEFFASLRALIYQGTEEAQTTPAKYGGDEGRALLGCKTKIKVSGQFLAEESARNFAVIKTYLETCVRNGVNEMDALLHLCIGMPYSVGDLRERDCE